MTEAKRIRERLLEYALGLPGAYENHPWGEDVVKVNKKVFVFLGVADSEKYPPGCTVKLSESHQQALAVEGAAPSGYGLGKAGWVSMPLTGALPPVEVLQDWVEESYRAVAPKRLVAELDERAAGS
jgi:predicted DNA-binding protein (MmcQ/YjbR family)